MCPEDADDAHSLSIWGFEEEIERRPSVLLKVSVYLEAMVS